MSGCTPDASVDVSAVYVCMCGNENTVEQCTNLHSIHSLR